MPADRSITCAGPCRDLVTEASNDPATPLCMTNLLPQVVRELVELAVASAGIYPCGSRIEVCTPRSLGHCDSPDENMTGAPQVSRTTPGAPARRAGNGQAVVYPDIYLQRQAAASSPLSCVVVACDRWPRSSSAGLAPLSLGAMVALPCRIQVLLGQAIESMRLKLTLIVRVVK